MLLGTLGRAPNETRGPVALLQKSHATAIGNGGSGRSRFLPLSYGPMPTMLFAVIILLAPSALAGTPVEGTRSLNADPGFVCTAGEAWIRPSSIVIADGVWSFLVKTRDLQAVSGMGLRIGATDYSPTLVVETTDSTAVLTFRHEAATSESSAHLRFPGGELAELRVLDGPGHKHERWQKGCISVVSRYGAIRYPPHARERSLDELEGTDESLLVLFRQIGCQSVTKSLHDQTENPSPEDSLISVRHGIPVTSRALYRNYLILINPEFSERALALIVGDHPAIEHASVNYMGTQYN